jgi:hypothetical protein
VNEPFAETLIALVESLRPVPGIVVERASLTVPLEGRVDHGRSGPVFHATLPHSRWESGLLPPVHVAHFDLAPPGEGE